METCITDVPRLNPDGSGKIELTSGDPAVPCIGVYKRCENKGYLLFTVQEIGGKNIGLAYEYGKMILTYPAKRDEIYQIFAMHKNEVPYIEEKTEIPYKLLEFDCHSIEEFYQKFFDNRKIMGMDDTLPPVLSKEEQWAIHAEKFDNYCWRENGVMRLSTSAVLQVRRLFRQVLYSLTDTLGTKNILPPQRKSANTTTRILPQRVIPQAVPVKYSPAPTVRVPLGSQKATYGSTTKQETKSGYPTPSTRQTSVQAGLCPTTTNS